MEALNHRIHGLGISPSPFHYWGDWLALPYVRSALNDFCLDETHRGEIPPHSSLVSQKPYLSEADPVESDPVAWVGAHWQEITRDYPNEWIVVANGRVVAHSEIPKELREQIGRLGIKTPFIAKVGSGPIVWRTAYGLL